MWSQIYLDYAFHTNFNVNFTSHKNDVHIQLSQWQYWWWFWFTAVWALYFLIILRTYNNKVETFNVTLNTSMRSHGKWGDFLVALIPLSWCGNILINSNFILRMLEWQNESSLFVIRIQGKQWYWAYKYNADTNFRLQNVFVNVGNNNWLSLKSNSNKIFNNSAINNFIYDYEFKKIYKEKLKNLQLINLNQKKNSFITNLNKYKLKNLLWQTDIQKLNKKNIIYKTNKILNLNHDNLILKSKLSSIYKIKNTGITSNLWYKYYAKPTLKSWYISNIHQKNVSNNKKLTQYTTDIQKQKVIDIKIKTKSPIKPINVFTANYTPKQTSFETDKLDNTFKSDENFRIQNTKFPIKLIKGILNKHNIQQLTVNSVLNNCFLFNLQINNIDTASKQSHVEQFWGFRQKRYKKLRPHSFLQNTKYTNNSYTHISNFTNTQTFNKYNLYTSIKNNKYKNELISVTLARRLLRTKRTLILPVHINITLITNSYDVVHSWFVPGLGLKMDCVPGRSTHHSLYIDNVGFYYGQCAEICGRYHHHMPIRVCALSFEHFMLWWQTKGLPRMYRSKIFLQNKNILLKNFY